MNPLITQHLVNYGLGRIIWLTSYQAIPFQYSHITKIAGRDYSLQIENFSARVIFSNLADRWVKTVAYAPQLKIL